MAPFALSLGYGVAIVLLLLVLYVYLNDWRILTIPDRIANVSRRLDAQAINELVDEYTNSPPKNFKERFPPKTGRRYIVVGGVRFLGVFPLNLRLTL